jgi:hypothetical protein
VLQLGGLDLPIIHASNLGEPHHYAGCLYPSLHLIFCLFKKASPMCHPFPLFSCPAPISFTYTLPKLKLWLSFRTQLWKPGISHYQFSLTRKWLMRFLSLLACTPCEQHHHNHQHVFPLNILDLVTKSPIFITTSSIFSPQDLILTLLGSTGQSCSGWSHWSFNLHGFFFVSL